MVSSFVQLKSILWKNWLLKWAHFSGFLAELALPVIFMSLLIMIKGLTTVYDSPNVAYYCGNTYPWFYSEYVNADELLNKDTPLGCLSKPAECTVHDYYKYSETFQPFAPNDDTITITPYSQYGFISSAASSGNADAPFYGYTIGDTAPLYNFNTHEFKLDNPSLPLCTIFNRMYYYSTNPAYPAIIALAPLVDSDPQLAQMAALLREFLLEWCYNEGFNYANILRTFTPKSAVESYVND